MIEFMRNTHLNFLNTTITFILRQAAKRLSSNRRWLHTSHTASLLCFKNVEFHYSLLSKFSL